MRKHNLNYVVIGLFVTAMLAVLVVAMALVTGRTGSTDGYTIVFDNVADVKFGTQVRFEGYPIGQVEGIVPFVDGGATRFRISVGVQVGWRIPLDSVARVGSSSFLGAPTIDIARGQSDIALAPGGQIAGAPSSDIFSTLNRVANEITEMNQELVRPLLTDLSLTVNSVGTELQTFSRRLNGSMDAVQRILSPENVQSIDAMLANFSRMSAQMKATSHRVDGLVVKVDAMLAENRGNVRAGLEDFRYVLRAVAQNIDAINHNLAGTSRNLNEFSRLIRQNPGLLLGGTARQEVEHDAGQEGGPSQAGGRTQTGEFR